MIPSGSEGRDQFVELAGIEHEEFPILLSDEEYHLLFMRGMYGLYMDVIKSLRQRRMGAYFMCMSGYYCGVW